MPSIETYRSGGGSDDCSYASYSVGGFNIKVRDKSKVWHEVPRLDGKVLCLSQRLPDMSYL